MQKPEQTETYAQFIERMRGVLLEKLTRYEAWTKRDLEGSQQVSLRVRQKLDIAVPHIHQALEAMNRGMYGICCDCEEEIPRKRMEAVPGATRCVACQTEASS